jgi:polysaccharide biosynthesis transport protein
VELEAQLKGDVARLAEQSRSVTQAAVDLSSVQEEIAHAEDVAQRIGAELEILNVELKAPPRVRLMEEAEISHAKDEMRQVKMAGMAGLGAVAAVVGCVSFWEFRARRIDSADEVVRGLGLRLVGALPPLPEGDGSSGAGQAHARRQESLLVESVDAVRAALLHASATESIRVVMVVSALGGEGKTTLACHLAASLARAGRRTLLVDGDLRRPAVHRMFDLAEGPGLGELLRGEAGLEEVIAPAPATGLWVIPAGRCDTAAIRALAREELGQLLGRLRERYDFLVIDSAPVLPVADALQFGQHVDAALFSILRGVSRAPSVHAAYERLSSLGIRQLGAVVMGTRCDHLARSDYQYATRD